MARSGVGDRVGFFSLVKSGSGSTREVCWEGLATSLGS